MNSKEESDKTTIKEYVSHLTQKLNSPQFLDLIAHTSEANDLLEELEQITKKTRLLFPNNLSNSSVSQADLVEKQKTQFESLEKNSTRILSSLKEDRYKILEVLGKGGMGIVELAYDENLKREVALKKIKQEVLQKTAGGTNLLWRFSREAILTASLEHPNIVPIYDFQIKENQLHYTMKKLEGKTLREYLKEEKSSKREERVLLGILLKVCEGMAYAHSKGVIHRDLKPENIMIGNYGEVYILDWGIAKKLEESNDEKMNSPIQKSVNETIGGIGTPGYMPPEQMNNATDVKGTADIYALGKILRECYTGLHPQNEIQVLDKPYKIQKNFKEIEQDFQKEFQKKVPREMKAIITKATKVNAEERYSSVYELARDIEKYIRGIPISVQEYRFDELFRKWIKRNRKSITVAVCLIFLILGFWNYRQWENQKRNQEEVQKRENAFKRECNEAKTQQEQANQITETGRKGRSLKTKHLLSALLSLDKALALYPNQKESEEQKAEVGKSLLQLCYEGGDFELAKYVADELKMLSHLSVEVKEKYSQEVDQKRDKVLTQHKETLFWWISKAKPQEKLEWKGLKVGEVEDFLFEVSQMKEPEIYENLMNEFREGVKIMLTKKHEERGVKEEEYCLYIIEILGRLGNENAIPELEKILEEMGEKIEKEINLNNNLSTINYIIVLAEALGNLKAKSCWSILDKIRKKMAQNRGFIERIELSTKKLAPGKILYYSTLLEKNPQDVDSYNNRGIAKFELEDYKGAIEDYTEAIRLNTQNAETYNNRGVAKEDLEDYESAIEDYTTAIRLNPQYTDAYNNRGDSKFELEDYKGAIEDYTEAIRLNPQFTEAYNNRGIAKQERDECEDAILDYTTAIRLDSQYAEAYSNRGKAKGELKRYQEALSDCNEAIRLDPKLIEAYTNRGNIKIKLENYEGAIQDYNEAIRLDPQDAEAYTNRGKAKETAKEYESAIQDYNEAIRLDPKLREAQKELIKILLLQYNEQFQKKAYSDAKESLLKIKKYLKPKDKRHSEIEKKIQEVEQLLQKEKK